MRKPRSIRVLNRVDVRDPKNHAFQNIDHSVKKRRTNMIVFSMLQLPQTVYICLLHEPCSFVPTDHPDRDKHRTRPGRPYRRPCAPTPKNKDDARFHLALLSAFFFDGTAV